MVNNQNFWTAQGIHAFMLSSSTVHYHLMWPLCCTVVLCCEKKSRKRNLRIWFDKSLIFILCILFHFSTLAFYIKAILQPIWTAVWHIHWNSVDIHMNGPKVKKSSYFHACKWSLAIPAIFIKQHINYVNARVHHLIMTKKKKCSEKEVKCKRTIKIC